MERRALDDEHARREDGAGQKREEEVSHGVIFGVGAWVVKTLKSRGKVGELPPDYDPAWSRDNT